MHINIPGCSVPRPEFGKVSLREHLRYRGESRKKNNCVIFILNLDIWTLRHSILPTCAPFLPSANFQKLGSSLQTPRVQRRELFVIVPLDDGKTKSIVHIGEIMIEARHWLRGRRGHSLHGGYRRWGHFLRKGSGKTFHR